MNSSNIRDLLTSFSPSLDFFAISTGDGRIKIWDTEKGQVQTEFADIVSIDATNFFAKPKLEGGHLSVDYTCMKWLSLEKKKKRKLRSSLLVLGTGSGDVLAFDVSGGQLKWRADDCHPGGVSAISFPVHGSFIYTAGADGMVCQLDSMAGNMLGKFKASTKPISSMSVSSDGKTLVTAAAQLKIFNCSDHKKIQKFSGHPGAVRCLIFSENGRYVLSSSVGERYVAVWRIDGSKKQSAFCVLAMDHPAVFLDCRCFNGGDADDEGLCVLAISEMGVCYFWHGKNKDELHNSKPTKIFISVDDRISKNQKGAAPSVFAANLQGVGEPASAHLFVAYGSLVKPSFEKVVVRAGNDMKLNSCPDGILLPASQVHKSKKGSGMQNQVTALDRANAEEALLPIPKIFNFVDSMSGAKAVFSKDDEDKVGIAPASLCMEDRLRSLGILSRNDDLKSSSMVDAKMLMGINLEAYLPPRKMRAVISSMAPGDVYNLLKALVTMWQSRSCSHKYVLPWISCILVNHSNYIMSQEPVIQLLDSLYKLTKSKGTAFQSLLQLSGRLQLVTTQIDKAVNKKSHTAVTDQHMDESEDEDEDEDVDEYLYGVEDEESQTSSDNDD